LGFSLEDGNSFVEEGNRKFEWIFIKTLKNFFFHETKKKNFVKRLINGCLNSVTEDFGRWHSLKTSMMWF
jgi:hypothetical protein